MLIGNRYDSAIWIAQPAIMQRAGFHSTSLLSGELVVDGLTENRADNPE